MTATEQLNAARSLLNLEGDFVSLDMRLQQLTRHVLLTNLDEAPAAARRVRRARVLLQKTLWDFSAAITDAVLLIEANTEDVPY